MGDHESGDFGRIAEPDVITIENFTTKLPQILESEDKLLYGLVDMGSNGIRFSISDLSGPRRRLLSCIYRERVGISLYDALHESTPDSKPFYFSETTIELVANTLQRFRGICSRYGVRTEHILVFATEAMRTAKNKREMLSMIYKTSELKVEIVSPSMESLFGAMGARSGFEEVDGLFMDLGGGSVQMTYLNSKHLENYGILAAEAARSLPFGAARLSAALNTQETADMAKKDLRRGMKETFEAMKERFPHLKQQADHEDGVTIYFCGGGFRGYGSMLMHTDPIQPYPIPAIGGYAVPGHRFVQWQKMLHESQKDGKVFGVSKRRKQQFPAIVEVVRALVDAVPKIKRVIFCSGGNREGVLYMKLPPSFREANPLVLVPGGMVEPDQNAIESIIQTIFNAVPETPVEDTFPTHQLLLYVAKNMYLGMGNTDDANSARALHNPISGDLARVPGMTHRTQAIYALTMCARWGTDLGPVDRSLFQSLRGLIGPETSFLCEYIGTVARGLASLVPAFPIGKDDYLMLRSLISKTEWVTNLGKKGKKPGIRLSMTINPRNVYGYRSPEAITDIFTGAGKGFDLGWKVELNVQVLEE